MNMDQAYVAAFLAEKSSVFASADALPALFIRYIGTEASCLIGCQSTTGDVLSKVGDLASEAADANFMEAASQTEGQMDVSEATADTLGELVAVINALDDYEAGILNGLEATSTTATLLATAYAQANSLTGKVLYYDTSALKGHVITSTRMKKYVSYPEGTFPTNINDGYTHGILRVDANMSFSAGNQYVEVYDGETRIARFGALTSGTEANYDLHGVPICGTSGNPVSVVCVNDGSPTAGSTGWMSAQLISEQK